MTTVRGYLQLFQTKIKFADYREQYDTMIEELDRANEIITEFLYLYKNKAVEMIHTFLRFRFLIISIIPAFIRNSFGAERGVRQS